MAIKYQHITGDFFYPHIIVYALVANFIRNFKFVDVINNKFLITEILIKNYLFLIMLYLYFVVVVLPTIVPNDVAFAYKELWKRNAGCLDRDRH